MAGRPEAYDWEVGDRPSISPETAVLATAPEQFDRRSVENERYLRRIFLAVLAVFLAFAVVGAFGVRTTTTTATGGGHELQVTYPRVTRPGLASAFYIQITRQDGSPLAAPVTVAVSSTYLRLYDQNATDPRPVSETATGDVVIWEFNPPLGSDTLSVQLDMSVEPAVQWGRDGFVRVLDEDGTVVESRFHTWVMP